MKIRPRHTLLLLGLFALTLAGCDSCGDLIRGQGGAAPLSCKGDGPKPN